MRNSSKTSASHPLMINSVPAGAGHIGLTFCPGKKQVSAFSGVWDRDLNADLIAIKNWGASTLVTLIEDYEFGDLKVPNLGERAEANGLEWYHAPIVDVDVPDSRLETVWPYLGHRLRAILLTGGKIVLHCKGGLGRTGTIAAKLMVELGADPEEAIKQIRAARPGSIETSSQEKYVRNQSIFSGEADHVDRVYGCLLGGAVGDGFGYEVEFQKLKAIRDLFGPYGIRTPVFHHGKLIVSDDTQMTVFTIEGMLRSLKKSRDNSVGKEIIESYQDWLSTQGDMPKSWKASGTICNEAVFRQRRAPGNTCLSALKMGGWGTLEKHINDSKGCGGVMRVAPIGLVRSWSPDQVFEIAAQAAATTHGHPSGYLSAGAMAAMVRMLIDGVDLATAVENVYAILSNYSGHEETTKALASGISAYRECSADTAAAVAKLGEGWIGEEALAVGVYAALVGKSFPEVLAIAANHDGDSDSTASIAGQLYGAWKGCQDLPHEWVRRLDVFEPMMALIADFLVVANQSRNFTATGKKSVRLEEAVAE